jgi:hypothetical protein
MTPPPVGMTLGTEVRADTEPVRILPAGSWEMEDSPDLKPVNPRTPERTAPASRRWITPRRAALLTVGTDRRAPTTEATEGRGRRGPVGRGLGFGSRPGPTDRALSENKGEELGLDEKRTKAVGEAISGPLSPPVSRAGVNCPDITKVDAEAVGVLFDAGSPPGSKVAALEAIASQNRGWRKRPILFAAAEVVLASPETPAEVKAAGIRLLRPPAAPEVLPPELSFSPAQTAGPGPGGRGGETPPPDLPSRRGVNRPDYEKENGRQTTMPNQSGSPAPPLTAVGAPPPPPDAGTPLEEGLPPDDGSSPDSTVAAFAALSSQNLDWHEPSVWATPGSLPASPETRVKAKAAGARLLRATGCQDPGEGGAVPGLSFSPPQTSRPETGGREGGAPPPDLPHPPASPEVLPPMALPSGPPADMSSTLPILPPDAPRPACTAPTPVTPTDVTTRSPIPPPEADGQRAATTPGREGATAPTAGRLAGDGARSGDATGQASARSAAPRHGEECAPLCHHKEETAEPVSLMCSAHDSEPLLPFPASPAEGKTHRTDSRQQLPLPVAGPPPASSPADALPPPSPAAHRPEPQYVKVTYWPIEDEDPEEGQLEIRCECEEDGHGPDCTTFCRCGSPCYRRVGWLCDACDGPVDNMSLLKKCRIYGDLGHSDGSCMNPHGDRGPRSGTTERAQEAETQGPTPKKSVGQTRQDRTASGGDDEKNPQRSLWTPEKLLARRRKLSGAVRKLGVRFERETGHGHRIGSLATERDTGEERIVEKIEEFDGVWWVYLMKGPSPGDIMCFELKDWDIEWIPSLKTGFECEKGISQSGIRHQKGRSEADGDSSLEEGSQGGGWEETDEEDGEEEEGEEGGEGEEEEEEEEEDEDDDDDDDEDEEEDGDEEDDEEESDVKTPSPPVRGRGRGGKGKPCCGCRARCSVNCKCLTERELPCSKDCRCVAKGTCSLQVPEHREHFEALLRRVKMKKENHTSTRSALLDLTNGTVTVASKIAVETNPMISCVPEGPARVWLRDEYTFWFKRSGDAALTEGERKRALDVISIIPFLILQKSTRGGKNSWGFIHIANRRISMWKAGQLDELVREATKVAQQRFEQRMSRKDEDEESKGWIEKVIELVKRGEMRKAADLCEEEKQARGPVVCDEEVKKRLRKMHPKGAPLDDLEIDWPAIDMIDEELVRQTAMKLRGAPGPSGMPTDLVRMLVAEKKREGALELRKAIAMFLKRLMTVPAEKGTLESFTVARLVALEKNDAGDVRPIGIGEAWRRLCLKTVGKATRKDVMEQCGIRQVCAGQPAGCEAAAHWMRDEMEEKETEMILLVDASNAFNAANRGMLLKTVAQRVPSLAMAARNTYVFGSDLILADGSRIRSTEGTTQGCPIAMQCFALSVLPLMEEAEADGVSQEWYADDSAGVGTVSGAFDWFRKVMAEGGKYGYHVNAKKTVAIVKKDAVEHYLDVFKRLGDQAEQIQLVILEDLEGDDIGDDLMAHIGPGGADGGDKPRDWGSRYLGAGMGGSRFREAYAGQKIEKWTTALQRLALVAEVDPQVGYSLLVHGMVPRWRFLMRSTPTEPEWFQPMEDAIAGPVCEALFEQKADGMFRKRLALPCRHGGLGIPDPRQMSGEEYAASKRTTAAFSELIAEGKIKAGWQEGIRSKKARKEIRKEREAGYERAKGEVKRQLVGRQRKGFEEAQGRGQSAILTAVPTTYSGTWMPALWWRVAIQLRLGLHPKSLPAICPDCGKANSVDHALGGEENGKCGGAVNRRHNEIVRYVKKMAEEAGLWVDGRPEPAVGKIGGPESKEKDTRCDGIVRGLVTPQREAWLDVQVVDTGAWSHLDEAPEKTLEKAERGKKEKHARRVRVAHNADFLPIVCSVYGTTAFHCQRTIKSCTELMMGKGATEDVNDLGRVLHLNRARFQAAVWRATALCVVGRRGGRRMTEAEAKMEKEEREGKELSAAVQMPWLCVAEDARAAGSYQ